ncbi:hypothetical protein BSN85_21655 [Bradyrhizobium brasilense]|nr:hypothetical protein BSN85_21655 [Bradyrhizobium brasilense]
MATVTIQASTFAVLQNAYPSDVGLYRFPRSREVPDIMYAINDAEQLPQTVKSETRGMNHAGTPMPYHNERGLADRDAFAHRVAHELGGFHVPKLIRLYVLTPA